jgi:hypothetical protein
MVSKQASKYARRVARVWASSQPQRPTRYVARGMYKLYRTVKAQEVARLVSTLTATKLVGRR